MEKLDRLGWVVHRNLQIDEFTIGVRSTSPELEGWLEYALKEYILPGEPEEFERHYSFLVADPDQAARRRKAHIVYRAMATLVRSFDLPTVGKAFLDELAAYRFTTATDALYLEASPLEVDGKVALIPSYLLSMLAKHGNTAQRAGVNLGIARHVRVELDTGRLLPLPEPLDIPADALDRLGEIIGGESEKDRFSIDDELSVDALFVTDNLPHMVMEVSRPYILRQLAWATTNLQHFQQRALETLATMLEGPRTFAVNYTRPKQVLEAMAGAMTSMDRKAS